MNLPTFLNHIDQLTSVSSKEHLSSFIHNYARTLPESQRSVFLTKLQTSSYEGQSENVEDIAISESVKSCIADLNKINENENIFLRSEYNEEYDDWYEQNEDEDKILFKDPDRILSTINQALTLVHTCTDTEQYQSGYQLACVLSKAAVQVSGEFYGETMNLSDLNIYNLIDAEKYSKFPEEAAYLAYMASDPTSRASNICQLMNNLGWRMISLESIMQKCDHDLPDIEEFLPLWIETLCSYSNSTASYLLEESISMLDENQQLIYAQKFAEKHPELYLNILSRKSENQDHVKKMMQAGINALSEIPVKYAIRSEIALLTAEYAYMQHKNEIVEKCWLEAFRSRCSVENYLRIRLESKNWNDYAVEIRTIYENTHRVNSNDFSRYQLRYSEPCNENCIGNNEYEALLFFDARFSDLFKKMNPSHALGWSSTFLKQEIALFLLLVQKYSKLPKGLSEMMSIMGTFGITDQTYYRGIAKKQSSSENELFHTLFFRWKKNISLTKEITASIMDMINHLINHRVTGIMNAKRRNYYPECAAFIAAYGETEESLGKPEAKEIMIEYWHNMYPRRTGFTAALKSYLS